MCTSDPAGTDPSAECGDGVCSGIGWCAEGVPAWAKSFGGSAIDGVNDIDVDGDNVVLGIQFENGISLGTSSYNGSGVAVARFDGNGTPTWSKAFTGSAAVGAIDTCPNGDLIFGGLLLTAMSFGGSTLTPTAPFDMYIARIDASGGHVWSDVYGAPDAAEVTTGIACTGDGSTFVVGTFTGTVQFSPEPELTSLGQSDIFVAKLAANGSCIWSKSFGDASNQGGSAVALTSDGGLVISGSFSGAVDFGGGPLSAGSGSTQYLAKLDGDGNHIWSRSVAESPNLVPADLSFDANDNIYVTGRFEDNAAFDGETLEGAGGTDVFVAKFDPLGEFVWANGFGNFNDQSANGLAVSPEGFVVVGGSFTGSIQPGDMPLSSAGGQDGFLVAFSPDGDHVWSLAAGGSGDVQRVDAVGMYDNGDVVATGSFNGLMSVGDFPLTSGGESDIFLTRVAR